MILAYKNGTLILVSLVIKMPKTTIVECADGKQYCYRKTDDHRKLFDGKNAVYDVIDWIDKESK